MKKILLSIVMVFVLMLCFTGCINNEMAQQSSTKQSIDIPQLNGKYAYLRVNVLSKDIDSKTMQVIVVDFGSFEGVNIGNVPIDTEGELDCSDLLMMGGIKEGEWVVSYIDKGQNSLPLKIYSIESIDEFRKRVQNGIIE